MYKSVVLLLIHLFVIEGILYSQTDVFYKLYDYNNQYDGTMSILETSDNYYVISGGTYNISIPSDALYIIKTNQKGDTLWTLLYDTNPQGETAYSTVETLEHNYLISGTMHDTTEGKNDFFLLSIKNDGGVNWLKQYGGNDNDYNEKVIITSDGGYLLAGSTLSNTNGYEDAYLVKTDSLGNQQWAKQYGDTNADAFNSVIQTTDGGFAAVGYTYSYGTYNRVYLVKTDSAGNMQWYKSYPYQQGAGASDLKQTSDGGYIIAADFYESATDQTDAYLLKTDGSGIKQWEKIYSLGNETEYFHTVYLYSGGYYLAGGTADYTQLPPAPRGWLLKADINGDTLWTKTYTYYGGSSSDYLYDMQPTNDGGFVMSGMIINNPLPYKNDIFVIKTDSLGNTCVPVPASHDGCWDTITEAQSPKFQASGSRVLIYPNPSQGLITVEYSSGYLLEIIDFTGKKVFLQQFSKSENKTQLNLKGLNTGIYYYKITGADVGQSGKIILID